VPFNAPETSLSLLHRELIAGRMVSRTDRAVPTSAADTEATATPATPEANQPIDVTAVATVAIAKPPEPRLTYPWRSSNTVMPQRGRENGFGGSFGSSGILDGA